METFKRHQVSIVIPHCPLTVQHNDMLARCVKSLRGGLEHIIVVNQMGFGAACNLGVSLARAQFVAIVNNDTICQGNWVMSDLCDPEAVTFPVINGVVQEFSGAFLVLPRWVINTALRGQVYDEQFKIGFWEDVDLWTRLKNAGVPIRQVKCDVGHPAPGSTMKFMPRDTDSLNRKRYLAKHGRVPLKTWV